MQLMTDSVLPYASLRCVCMFSCLARGIGPANAVGIAIAIDMDMVVGSVDGVGIAGVLARARKLASCRATVCARVIVSALADHMALVVVVWRAAGTAALARLALRRLVTPERRMSPTPAWAFAMGSQRAFAAA